MKGKILTASLLAMFLCSPNIIFAETVVLKSGTTVEGKIIEKTAEYIKIDFQGVPLTNFLDEVKSIDGQAIVPDAKETVSVPRETNKAAGGMAEALSPNEIFDKVIATYKSLETYKSKGTTTADMEIGGMKGTVEAEFSIILKKPNLYLISWTQSESDAPGIVQSGAVWSDGAQAYLYADVSGVRKYSKMKNDETAMSAATGVSGGATLIPSIFLPVGWKSPFSQVTNAKLEKEEKVGEEDCYVISGSSPVSKKEIYWISKNNYLLLKVSRSINPLNPDVIPKVNDERVKQALDAFKAMNSKMQGFETQLHTDISSPQLSKTDFQFSLPEGAEYREFPSKWN